MKIPSEYFLSRGFSRDVLTRYDVGECLTEGKPLYGRAVVPVYDASHTVMLGATARSPFGQCRCGSFHKEGTQCPHQQERFAWSKWRNTDGFRKESFLYNYWSAKKLIRDSGIVCLCEGPADVWRLEEAGIHIGLAMFGADLSDQQQVILECSGAMNVVVLTDNDETGRLAEKKIRKQLERCFRVISPAYQGKDVGSMGVEQVRKEILPVLQQIRERGY